MPGDTVDYAAMERPVTSAQVAKARVRNLRYRRGSLGSPALERPRMYWQRRLAALFVVLALAGCAQGTTGQAGAPDRLSSPVHQDRSAPEHGGGDGGGGAM